LAKGRIASFFDGHRGHDPWAIAPFFGRAKTRGANDSRRGRRNSTPVLLAARSCPNVTVSPSFPTGRQRRANTPPPTKRVARVDFQPQPADPSHARRRVRRSVAPRRRAGAKPQLIQRPMGGAKLIKSTYRTFSSRVRLQPFRRAIGVDRTPPRSRLTTSKGSDASAAAVPSAITCLHEGHIPLPILLDPVVSRLLELEGERLSLCGRLRRPRTRNVDEICNDVIEETLIVFQREPPDRSGSSGCSRRYPRPS